MADDAPTDYPHRDVTMRFFFNRSAVESFEISGYGLAACIGLGLAFTAATKAQIRVAFVVARFPFPLRAACVAGTSGIRS